MLHIVFCNWDNIHCEFRTPTFVTGSIALRCCLARACCFPSCCRFPLFCSRTSTLIHQTVPLQLFCWIILTTQPFYIAGIEDAGKAQSSAFGAVVMFVATFAMSIGGIWYDSMHKAEPIVEDGSPEAEYQLTKDGVPSYGAAS